MSLKVLFISRATLWKDKGGDTVQIVNTAKYLQPLGVEVDIRLCNEEIDYSGYQLIHFFNIIRPADILLHIQRSGLPYVISTIFVDYSEYERKARGGKAGLLAKLLPSDWLEYVKVLARAVLNGEKIISKSYLWLGQKRSIRKLIRGSSFLLPNSHSEYKRLEKKYGIAHAYKVVPNAIDSSLFRIDPSIQRESDLVICAGRIEGRKNQLKLIKALNNTKYKLVIIGSPGPNQQAYDAACRAAAASNVSFVSNIPQQELLRYYQRAKVHVLPSWFETTGLSTLEAAVMGCNIVITDKGDTREYFMNYAWYCDPMNEQTIFAAVESAAAAPFNEELRSRIQTAFTWNQTAQATLDAYRQVPGIQSKL